MKEFIELTEYESKAKIIIPCSSILIVVDCDEYCFIKVDKILRKRRHQLYVVETFEEIKALLH